MFLLKLSFWAAMQLGVGLDTQTYTHTRAHADQANTLEVGAFLHSTSNFPRCGKYMSLGTLSFDKTPHRLDETSRLSDLRLDGLTFGSTVFQQWGNYPLTVLPTMSFDKMVAQAPWANTDPYVSRHPVPEVQPDYIVWEHGAKGVSTATLARLCDELLSTLFKDRNIILNLQMPDCARHFWVAVNASSLRGRPSSGAAPQRAPGPTPAPQPGPQQGAGNFTGQDPHPVFSNAFFCGA